MGETRCNTLQFNASELMASLVSYFVEVMGKMEEKTIEVMRQELQINGDGPRASSDRIMKWKAQVSGDIQLLYRDIAVKYIESTVGVDNSDDEVFRKAVIIAVGGGPKHAGPKGRTVWDEDYSGTTESKRNRYDLPATWILGGNAWFKNAVKKMRVYFFDMLDSAAAKLPDVIFYGNLHVT